MSTFGEIEDAVNALPLSEQKALFEHLTQRLQIGEDVRRRLPLVPATGHPITQEEIDDALDAD